MKAIGLIRVSTDAQDTERQKTGLERTRKRDRLEIERRVELVDVSGTDVGRNPEILRIIHDLQRPDIDGVAIAALDRLFRPDCYGDFAILDHFRKNRKLIFSASEGVIDPSTPEGFQKCMMSSLQAGMEWRILRQRTMEGKEEKRQLGFAVNGPQALPRGIGFRKVIDPVTRAETPEWFYIDPDRSRVLRAYELILQNWNYRAIAEEIGDFSWYGIYKTLRNPIWMGIRRHDQEKCKSEKRVSKKTGKPYKAAQPRADVSEVLLPIEPLVSREVWEAAQKIMADRQSRWKRKLSGARFVAAGLVRCSCGEPFYMKCDRRKHQHDYYYCRSLHKGARYGCGQPKIRREALDEAVDRLVTEFLLNAKLIRQVLNRNEVADERGAERASTDKAIAKLNAKRANLIEMRMEGSISAAEFKPLAAAIDAELKQLKSLAPPPQMTGDAKEVAGQLAGTFARFDTLRVAEKRVVLRRAIKSIIVAGTAIPMLTLNGGFIGSKSISPSTSPYWRQWPAPAQPRRSG
jgi:site-specific DNA recombinase